MVARIGKDNLFLAVQQGVPLDEVIDSSSGSDGGMYQVRVYVHTNVCLHSKVPLLAFLGLVHVRTTFAVLVLGEAWPCNQGGIDQRAGLEHQTLLGQRSVGGSYQLQVQVVFFEQVTKSQNGGLVRQSRGTWVQAGKFPVRLKIVPDLFHGRAARTKPLPQEVNTQHGLHDKCGSSDVAACARLKQLNQANEIRLRNHQIHLIKEHAFANFLGDKLISGTGNTDVFHQDTAFLNPAVRWVLQSFSYCDKTYRAKF